MNSDMSWSIGYIQYLYLNFDYRKLYQITHHQKEEYWLETVLYFLTIFDNCHLGCSEELVFSCKCEAVE